MTMRTYNCDRCGEKMPRKSEPFKSPTSPISNEDLEQGVTLPLPLKVDSGVAFPGGFAFPHIDLCGPCVESLWKWLSKTPE
jgi:hypothetical protein